MVRQSIVRLLILLKDARTIEPLRLMSLDKRLSRPVRLSAALALAGMEEIGETYAIHRHTRVYAIS